MKASRQDTGAFEQGQGGKARFFGVSAELALMIAIAILVFAVLSGIASDYIFKKVLSQNMETTIKEAVLVTRNYVEGDLVEEYLETKGSSKSAQELQQDIQAVCNDAGFNYVYLQTVDLDSREITNVVSARSKDRPDLPTYQPGQVTTTDSQDNWDAYRSILSDGADYASVYRLHNSYAERASDHITGMAVVRDSSNEPVAMICVEAPFSWYEEALLYYRLNLFACVLLVLVFCVAASVIATRKRIAQPVRAISLETQRFARGNTLEEGTLSKEQLLKNELGFLARSVNSMEGEIVESIASIEHMTAESERLAAELDIASAIQEAVMPHQFPAFPEKTEFDLFASMRPAKEVGGDFYDFFLVDEDHLALVIADVSGKGIPAALFMMNSKGMLQNYTSLLKEPAAALEAVNNQLSIDNDAAMFVTVWLGIVEISTGLIKAASAGHEPCALRRAGGEYELLRDKHGFVVGPMEGMRYPQYEIRMEPGDSLLLYTDGLPDARNSKGEFFTSERMIEALNECDEETPQHCVERMNQRADEFVDGAERFDDLTMLAFKYLG